jgi:hypothetical protein
MNSNKHTFRSVFRYSYLILCREICLFLFRVMLFKKEFKHLTNKINILNKKFNLLYIRNQSVPRCKHFPPRLYKPIS